MNNLTKFEMTRCDKIGHFGWKYWTTAAETQHGGLSYSMKRVRKPQNMSALTEHFQCDIFDVLME